MSQTSGVTALTNSWRKSAEHLTEQASRFVRLTVIAAVPSVWNLIQGGKFDWHTLLSFVLPFAEVAYRQVFPALPANKAVKAPIPTALTQTPPPGDAAP